MTDADSAVPPRLDEDAISKLELTEVADLIRTRQLTSAEVTESTLRRIERLDPQLKSYAFVMPETALAAARAADADIARGHYEGVLHGVPIGVKDLCYTVDAPTAAGTTIFRDFRPAYDATVVARLRAAGAVIIGKLAMTEGPISAITPVCRPRSIPGTRQRGRACPRAAAAWPPRRDCASARSGRTPGGRFAFRRACAASPGSNRRGAGSAVTASSNLRQATTTSGRSPVALTMRRYCSVS